jgi:hypothetical protein
MILTKRIIKFEKNCEFEINLDVLYKWKEHLHTHILDIFTLNFSSLSVVDTVFYIDVVQTHLAFTICLNIFFLFNNNTLPETSHVFNG